MPSPRRTSTSRRRHMTKLQAPEQWVLQRMNEMEVAEMIEEHIDYYVENEEGERRSVHLPMQFVRHYVKRPNDNALPTVVAIATAPIVLAHGALLAPDGLEPLPRPIFIIKEKITAV